MRWCISVPEGAVVLAASAVVGLLARLSLKILEHVLWLACIGKEIVASISKRYIHQPLSVPDSILTRVV